MNRTHDVAHEVLLALADHRQLVPFSECGRELSLRDAYRVTAEVRRMREARGERVVGRKIGFTNRATWPEYEPMWGYVYDTTFHWLDDLQGSFDIRHLIEPRIEPEIVLSLVRAPEAGMDEHALLTCIGWVAHGFEIVQSLFPAWRFTAPDTIAAFGLHGALVVGPRQPVTQETITDWVERLSSFEVNLMRNGASADQGTAGNVLDGGPLAALKYLVEGLAQDPESPPLSPGEIVTTGTLTGALPITPGETWTTELRGVPLQGIRLVLSD